MLDVVVEKIDDLDSLKKITIWKINRDKCSFNKKAELEPNYACEHSAIKSVFYSYCLLFLWILIKLWKQENCEVHTYFQKAYSTKPQLMTTLIDCNSDYSHSRIILRVNRFTRNEVLVSKVWYKCMKQFGRGPDRKQFRLDSNNDFFHATPKAKPTFPLLK